jgi:uncharacterized protein
MERSREPDTNKTELKTQRQIQTLSAIVARMQWATQLGLQYGGDRDLYQALGYPTSTELKFEDFYARYIRQDMAKAIIDRPVKATWQGPLEMLESNKMESTEFEKAWIELNKKFGLKTILTRVDRLTGIGRYGILLLGLDDTKSPEDFVNPVGLGGRELMYIKPFGERSAKIDTYEINPKNPRYGMPLYYSIEVQDIAGNASMTVKVHQSRIIHIVDDNLESEVFGTPRLEAVYNRLMDLDKIVGGDAEMFWRGARPGYHAKVDKDYTMTQQTKDDLQEELDEFEHNLRRVLVNEGLDMTALAPQVSDPSPHVNVILQMISSVTGIPIRVLTGSERGELASSQDTGEWLSYVQSRREEHAEPRIIRPMVDRFIELGILPKPGKTYSIKWADIFAQGEKARVEIGKARANALREYTYSPLAMEVLPIDAFLETCMGYTTDQIELMDEMREKSNTKEVLEEINDIMTPPVTPTTPTNPKTPTKPKVTRTR